MSFFDDASWVLIPEGIKEDVVYAQKPTNGLGDLQFTRASDATRTNSAGVIERTPWNLLQSSNTFNTTWIPAFATVTIGQSGYDGTNNAWLLSKSLADGRISQNVTLTSGAYTYSAYLKAGTKNWGFLRVDGVSIKTAYFNLQNGTLGTASGCTSSILSVGGGWYRCSITFTDSVTIARIYVADANNDLSGTSGNILIQAAQLVEGTDAKPYFATTNRQDVPRLHYRNADGTLNSCPRLLLEPQRTNSIRNSTMVGAVAGSPGTLPTNWSLTTGGLTQTIVGIGTENGLQYMDVRFNGTASGAVSVRFETLNGISASAAQSWTISTYVRYISGTANSASLLFDEWTSASAYLNTQSGPVVVDTTLSRVSLTRTTSTNCAFVQPFIRFILTVGATYDFTIRIAAPQMELGAYATTFIPTTTAAVTRVQDLIADQTTSVAAAFTDNSKGIIFFDMANVQVPIIGSEARFRFGNSATPIQISMLCENSGISFFSYNGNFLLTTKSTANRKIAIRFDGTQIVAFVNGVKQTTFNGPVAFNIEQMTNNITSPCAFGINQFSTFPTLLTDAQCIQLTT